MGQIGTLLTGAGVITTISGQDQMEAYMYLGDIDTACPLTGIQVELNGVSTFNVQGSQPLVSAVMKYLQQAAAATVGLQFKFGTGKIRQPTTYRLTNAGATTPAILAYSDDAQGKPVYASTVTINPLAYGVFTDFTALFITASANVASIDIEWKNGNRNTLSVLDIDAMFSSKFVTEANGRLDAVVSAIDNSDGKIKSVQITAAATALNVVKMKFAEEDFKQLQAEIFQRN